MRKTEKSENIKTPVWNEPLRFHTGGIIKFWGPMESGKTRAMIAYIFSLCKQQGFRNDMVFANCWLDLPGAHHLSNDEMRKVLRRAFNTETGAGRWNHCIFVLMDADDIYSHVTQADQECYKDIKKASQAFKRNLFLFYEIHEGLGVPKYMRDKSEVSIRPIPVPGTDTINLYIADGHYSINYVQPIHNISAMNSKYRRFDENY